MTDETADLIAFVRAAGGQVTNRMVLQLCDALAAAAAREQALTDALKHLIGCILDYQKAPTREYLIRRLEEAIIAANPLAFPALAVGGEQPGRASDQKPSDAADADATPLGHFGSNALIEELRVRGDLALADGVPWELAKLRNEQLVAAEAREQVLRETLDEKDCELSRVRGLLTMWQSYVWERGAHAFAAHNDNPVPLTTRADGSLSALNTAAEESSGVGGEQPQQESGHD